MTRVVSIENIARRAGASHSCRRALVTNPMLKTFAGFLLSVCMVLGAARNVSIATRVAAADYPLNLLNVNDRYLVSTNNGYGKQYLQSYDAIRRQVTGKLELPSLWFGLAYESENRLASRLGWEERCVRHSL